MTMIRREAIGHRRPVLPAPGPYLLGDEPQASLERPAVLPENLSGTLPHRPQATRVAKDGRHFLGQLLPIANLPSASCFQEQPGDVQAMIGVGAE
jgi:hypothetical protein